MQLDCVARVLSTPGMRKCCGLPFMPVEFESQERMCRGPISDLLWGTRSRGITSPSGTHTRLYRRHFMPTRDTLKIVCDSIVWLCCSLVSLRRHCRRARLGGVCQQYPGSVVSVCVQVPLPTARDLSCYTLRLFLDKMGGLICQKHFILGTNLYGYLAVMGAILQSRSNGVAIYVCM